MAELTEEALQKITDDLNARDAKLDAFIVQVPDGIQLIQYNEKGIVTYLSDPVKRISISERKGTNMICPICDIGPKE